jgi:hypothetical protein
MMLNPSQQGGNMHGGGRGLNSADFVKATTRILHRNSSHKPCTITITNLYEYTLSPSLPPLLPDTEYDAGCMHLITDPRKRALRCDEIIWRGLQALLHAVKWEGFLL